jgi:hypothetical protein
LNLETRLLTRVETLESSIELMQKDAILERSENQRLNSIITSLRNELIDVQKNLQVDHDQVSRLGNQITNLSKKLETSEKTIKSIQSMKFKNSPNQTSRDGGPSLVMVRSLRVI